MLMHNTVLLSCGPEQHTGFLRMQFCGVWRSAHELFLCYHIWGSSGLSLHSHTLNEYYILSGMCVLGTTAQSLPML